MWEREREREREREIIFKMKKKKQILIKQQEDIESITSELLAEEDLTGNRETPKSKIKIIGKHEWIENKHEWMEHELKNKLE